MRFFAPFLSVVTLMTSALAVPHAAIRGKTATRDAAADFLDGTQVGQGTWYNPGLGSCGITNTDSDYIAAVSYILYDSYPGYGGINPNSNPVCGRKIAATYQGGSVTITVTDRCEACAETDLDFSPVAFSQLADISAGRFDDVNWHWADHTTYTTDSSNCRIVMSPSAPCVLSCPPARGRQGASNCRKKIEKNK